MPGQRAAPASAAALAGSRHYLHDFLLLGVERSVDILDMGVGQLLQLIALGMLVVLADLVILLQPS